MTISLPWEGELLGCPGGFACGFGLCVVFGRFVVLRKETVEHGMRCFAELVRLLLGHAAIAANKLEHGLSLCILGVDIAMSAKGFCLRPSRDKVWLSL